MEHKCLENLQTDFIGFNKASAIGHCVVCGTAYCYNIKDGKSSKLVSYIRFTLIESNKR